MINKNILSSIAAFVLLICVPVAAQGQDTNPQGRSIKPLWEVVLGGIGAYSPDYPAADQNSLHGIALPYPIYRGKILRMGEDGIAKGVFIDNDYTEFNVSLAASFSTKSSDNNARRGMPDLDYLGEIGPQLKIKLGEVMGGKTELQLPVRAVFSSDFGKGIHHRGYLFNPKFYYKRQNIFDSGITLDSSIGSTFATKKLQEYFYGVEPRFATTTRPAFEADGGYLGSKITLGLLYDITKRVQGYVGGQIGYYGGAANEKSPLFRKKVDSTVLVGFIWSIFQSDTLVTTSE
jgi:MipA family protein